MFSKSARGQNNPTSATLAREMRELSQNALSQVHTQTPQSNHSVQTSATSQAAQLKQTLASASTTSKETAIDPTPPKSEAKIATEAEKNTALPTSAAHTQRGSCLMVGPAVKLKGAEILDCDTLIVEGRVEATMDSRVIQIAEAGSYSGKVSIDVAEIHGHFEGELTAREQLVIHTTGHVSGKIRYGKILIEAGGQISGDIQAIQEHITSNIQADQSSPQETQKFKLLSN